MFIECEMSIPKESQSVLILAVSFEFVTKINISPLSREGLPVLGLENSQALNSVRAHLETPASTQKDQWFPEVQGREV